MPSKKKTTIKKTTRTTATRKKTVRKKTAPKSATPKSEVKYININEPEAEVKNRLLWLSVSILGILLLMFWFWTMKHNIMKQQQDQNETRLGTEIEKTISDLKNILDNAQDLAGQASDAFGEKTQIERLKNEILSDIQLNMDSNKWPQHTSEITGISFHYPPSWYKSELLGAAAITSYESTTSTPAVLARISISRHSPADFDQVDDLAGDQYIVSDEKIPEIDTANKNITDSVRYDNKTLDEKDINYIIFLTHKGSLYEIEVFARNGRDLFEPIINQIISSIKFL